MILYTGFTIKKQEISQYDKQGANNTMKKIVAAIIKNKDKVLLIHRNKNPRNVDLWELPGGKAAKDERTKTALARELNEKLGINPKIDNMITSVKAEDAEIFVYNVAYDNNTIKLSGYDSMRWVLLQDISKYNLSPTDRNIVMHMLNIKPEKNKKDIVVSYIAKLIERPIKDEKSNLFIVKIHCPEIGTTSSFKTENLAMAFYVNTVRKLFNIAITPTTQIQR